MRLPRLFTSMFGSRKPIRFRRDNVAMVDLETFGLESTSGFYAIGARMFKFGTEVEDSYIDPDAKRTFDERELDLLQYIAPSEVLLDNRFTWSKSTIDWTHEKNQVEYDRAVVHGTESIAQALANFSAWIAYHKPRYLMSNSPVFDHAILRHAYKVIDDEQLGEFPMNFRSDFDVRTIGHLRDSIGMHRYAERGSSRLHSPLDDCTLQINALAGFVRRIETGK